ncbi:hypothetical protein [Synechococcus phage S-N03]|uniref:ParB/Sulfiredoxin domain-containing protein n=1 Tax=Synechococcus phage S-N03 TaxID=2718943 RepID=A0A6G8R6I0_9CAUD|nr:hypothetical protein PQC09_gp123 [Synechococcus phage S-N03]QIN96758.1 hypothetical protein [Synechococcus phage S-N03]
MDQDVYIDVSELEPLLMEPVILHLSEVAWKGKHLPDKFVGENCICCGGERYRACDPSFPAIVVKGTNNPYGLPYRLIDGKHRVQKLWDEGTLEAPFYVLTEDQLMDYTRTRRDRPGNANRP